MFAKPINWVQYNFMGDRGVDLQTLLTPQAFVRRNYSSYLYTPYSLKLHRRVYFYTHNGYDLWVHLEGAPDTNQFNERVAPVPIALENGQPAVLAPTAVSLNDDGTVVIHTIQSSNKDQGEKAEANSAAWQKWCDLNGFQHKEWTRELLHSNPIELANLKRLLRFVSCAGYIPNLALENSITAELENVRKITFAKLVQLFPLSDPDEVQQSLAKLILSRKVYSDIHLAPLSMITEVSAYHEFLQN